MGLIAVLSPLLSATVTRDGGFVDVRSFMVGAVLAFVGAVGGCLVLALLHHRSLALRRGRSTSWHSALGLTLAAGLLAIVGAATGSTTPALAIVASVSIVLAVAAFVVSRPRTTSWALLVLPALLIVAASTLWLLG